MNALLPKRWQWSTLEHVAASTANAIVDGPFGSNLKLSDYVENGVPVLQGKNITNDSFQWFDVRFISKKKAEELKRSSVKPGDLLIVKIGSIGYSAIIDDLHGAEFAIIPANLAKVTPNTNLIDTRYLYRWLTSKQVKIYLINAASKTAQPALSLTKLKNLPVPLPPLVEQRRLAAILDKADALRAKRRAALAQLDALTHAIFLDMFGDPVNNPMDWPVCAIGDIDLYISDGNYSSKYPRSSEFVSNGVPFIRANNLQNLTVCSEDMKFISPMKHGELKKGHLKEDDVLITTRGEIGRIAVVPEQFKGANINAQIVLLRPLSAQVNSRYLAYLLNFPQIKKEVQRHQTGVALKQLPVNKLVKIQLPVATPMLQDKFSILAKHIEKIIEVHSTSIRQLDKLFLSLQHRAFRGEL